MELQARAAGSGAKAACLIRPPAQRAARGRWRTAARRLRLELRRQWTRVTALKIHNAPAKKAIEATVTRGLSRSRT